MNQKKYTILTYNIGGYEQLHEVENVSNICEYVYITDDRSITSNTWNVVYIDSDKSAPFKTCYEIRFLKLWDYVHTDVVIRIDGSMRIIGNTDVLYNKFIESQCEIGLLFHPWRCLIIDEYKAWCDGRGYDIQQSEKCLDYIQNTIQWDLDNKGLFQLNVVIEKKSDKIVKLNQTVFQSLKELSTSKDNIERLDQTIYSAIYQKSFNDIKPFMMDYHVLMGNPFYWCWHNTNIPMPINDPSNTFYLNNNEYKDINYGDI